MMLSIPDALRAMQWLLVPSHLLALYSEQVLVHLLALVGLLALARLALRRYGAAVATLTLSATLTTTAPPMNLRNGPAPRRAAFAQHRLVHPAHAPHPKRNTASAAAAPDAQPPRSTTACLPPRPAPIEQQAPVARVPRQTRALSESELVTLANTAVIGPLIEACRQAAGGAR